MVISSGVLWLTSAYIAGVFAEQTGGGMASVIALFAIGLVPFGIAFVIQRIFFALEDTRTPFLVQLAQSAIFVVGALWAGTGPVENIADGIALSMSITILFQAIVMGILLRRRLGELGGWTLALAFVRFLGALVPAIFVGIVIRDALPGTGGSLLASMGFAALIGLGMGLVYQLTLLVFRDPSATALMAPLLRRGNNRP
jgi:putative peptidoglycan lipid II flippase